MRSLRWISAMAIACVMFFVGVSPAVANTEESYSWYVVPSPALDFFSAVQVHQYLEVLDRYFSDVDAALHPRVKAAAASGGGSVRLSGGGYGTRSDAFWYCINQHEQGGDWTVHGSRFSGGLGMMNSLWLSVRDPDWPENAGDASPEIQIIGANRAYNKVGPSAWSTSHLCADL